MIKTLGIDSYSVRKIIENYAGHLQVPTDWKHYKPPEEKKRARESAPIVKFSPEPTQENIKKKRKEEDHLKRRLKKLERNLGAIKANFAVLKDLMEARTVENEVVLLDRETLEFVEGRVRVNETSKPMTPICCGETFLYGICDPVSTINIMPSSLYEELHYNLNNPDVEPVETIIKLSNRINISPEGVIKNIHVFIGSLMYPLNFHIVDMPRDSFLSYPFRQALCFHNQSSNQW